jgi:hypothetical protein
MLSWAWALVGPLAIQGAAMGVDELYFHRKRGLGAWERIGHPLDTLTFLACIGWALASPPTASSIAVYVALAVVSCLFVTKDEFVHAKRCGPGEHWLHAVLFVFHPIVLACVGLLWPGQHATAALPAWLTGTTAASHALVVQFGTTAAFCVYQATYWNLPWQPRAQLDP